MSKFCELFKLNDVNIKSFYRLPVCLSDEECLLINDGRKSIAKVREHKLLHSWTLTHPHTLTCPVIVDRKDEIVYCVMDNKILLKWSLEDKDFKLKVAIKVKFQEAIFAVLSVYEQPPIILFSSGKFLSCEKLASDETSFGESFIGKGEEIIWADTTVQHSTVTVVCVGYNKENKAHTLHYFNASEDSVPEYHQQSLVNESGALVNYCLNQHSHSFLAIWSSGVVSVYHLDNGEQETLLTIPTTEKEILLAIDCIDSNQIVVFKSNPDLKEAYLEMWDIKFNVMSAKKVLDTWPTSPNQITVIGSIVYFSHNEKLVEIPFHAEKSTLAAAIGKSLTPTPKLQQLQWHNGKLIPLSYPDKNAIEEMDTSEMKKNPLNSTELLAQRLMAKGSGFLNYISEVDLVKLLCLAIKYKCKEKRGDASFEPDVVLNIIFSNSSFNNANILALMKRVSFEDSMAVLEVLLSFLNHKVYPTLNSDEKPTDLQLFNWMCIVIQSQLQVIFVSKNKKCIRLIRKLLSCVSEKVREYEGYESMQNFLIIIQKELNVLPVQHMVGKYCVESLETDQVEEYDTLQNCTRVLQKEMSISSKQRIKKPCIESLDT